MNDNFLFLGDDTYIVTLFFSFFGWLTLFSGIYLSKNGRDLCLAQIYPTGVGFSLSELVDGEHVLLWQMH